MAVDCQQVGRLRRQSVADSYRPAAAFVHRRRFHSVSERRPAAAFQRRHVFDQRARAYPVVLHPRADNAGSLSDFHTPFQSAPFYLRRVEAFAYSDLRPVFGRRAVFSAAAISAAVIFLSRDIRVV